MFDWLTPDRLWAILVHTLLLVFFAFMWWRAVRRERRWLRFKAKCDAEFIRQMDEDAEEYDRLERRGNDVT